jgi:hypothetical protein
VRTQPRELPAEDAPSFVRQSIARSETTHRAVVRFDAPIDVVRPMIPPDAGEFEAVDDDTSRFRTSTRDLTWLALQLARMAVDFTVEEPSQLVDILRELGARAAAAARRSDGAGAF